VIVTLHYLQSLFLPTALHTFDLKRDKNEQEAQLSQRNKAYYV